jgi:hypothetical protein
MATKVDADYAQAVQDDESRTIARAFLSTPSGTVLTADEIATACEEAEAQTEALIAGHTSTPAAAAGPVDAGDVKVGDLVRFVHGGETFEVREVEHHVGTDLYSFGVRHSLRQFVRHATEQVHRVAR